MRLFERICILAFLFCITFANAQLSICSWNIKDFGSSKSNVEITFIANTIKSFDIVAIQEVVAGDGGAQAVARLADELNRKGAQWDYVISNPTSSSAYKTERYAFLWKSKRVKKEGGTWLELKYHLEIDREPFYCEFIYEEKRITIANFHAITKSKQPETEIKYFKFLPSQYPDKNIVFLGDFNCPESHSVFNPLKKMKYVPILRGQKTSLKRECKSDSCLASEFDNIFYNSEKIKVTDSGALHFYENFPSLKEALLISDHIPIWTKLVIN